MPATWHAVFRHAKWMSDSRGIFKLNLQSLWVANSPSYGFIARCHECLRQPNSPTTGEKVDDSKVGGIVTKEDWSVMIVDLFRLYLPIVFLLAVSGLWLLSRTYVYHGNVSSESMGELFVLLPWTSWLQVYVGQFIHRQYIRQYQTKPNGCQNDPYQLGRTWLRGGATKKQRSDCNYVGRHFCNVRRPIRAPL